MVEMGIAERRRAQFVRLVESKTMARHVRRVSFSTRDDATSYDARVGESVPAGASLHDGLLLRRLESGRQFASKRCVGAGAHALGRWLRRADVDGDA